ncbi:MAG: hypothetical protein GW947_03990 [Candidatus Pacebacteria bacterium]|nr:hypothetical protein [Candidatus Paceibacterota bacterium]
MSNKIKVACVIPTQFAQKNSLILKKCIDSVIQQRRSIFSIDVFLVTNGCPSERSSFAGRAVKKTYYASASSGFSDLNNFALSQLLKNSEYELVLFLNDDCWLDKEFFSSLGSLNDFFQKDVFIPKIMNPRTGETDSFGVEYFRSGYAKNINLDQVDYQLFSATCVVVSTKLLKQLISSFGYVFNSLLYYYLEDVELAIRCRSLGATCSREQRLLAYHLGSTSSGKKSRFTMYQTYRNIIWVTLICWPGKALFRNLLNILLVQAWAFLISLLSFGPSLYFLIFCETIANRKKILSLRGNTLAGYDKKFLFSSILSQHSFRTHHGLVIPAV